MDKEEFAKIERKLDEMGYAIVPKVVPEAVLEASMMVSLIYENLIELARVKEIDNV